MLMLEAPHPLDFWWLTDDLLAVFDEDLLYAGSEVLDGLGCLQDRDV